MKDVYIISKVVARKGEAIASPSKGAPKIDFSDYLLKSIWEKVFEIRTDSQGTDYIFSKLPVVTQYGITMYSGDGVDIPSLASGLPFDGRTIWYNPDTNQIEVIGGTGGGSGEGVSNFWELSGIPSWITISKPKYTYSEIEGTPNLSAFATQDWIKSQGYASAEELKKYIPISGYTEVSGEKNFVGGLKVNGSPIYYDTEKKYWKLEGDLLVTGGVTMYGSDSSFTPSTIMDAIAVDGTTISKSGGVLKVIGGTGGGVADSVSWANITGKPTWIGSSKPSYSYSEITGAISTTELQNYLTQSSYLNVTSGDNRYLKLSGGTLKSGSSGTPLYIDSDVSESGIAVRLKGVNKTWIGYGVNYGAYLYNYANSNWIGIKDDGTPYFYNGTQNNLWHSGNDGSGSGLDADLLDGCHRKSWNGIPTVLSNGVMDIGRYIDFHAASDDGLDYAIRLECQGAYSNWVYLPSKTGTLALTIDNVASATKLQTARTIWGQSFDGTGNVSGNVKGSYFTIGDRDNAYIELLGGTNYGYVQMLADGSMAVGSNTSSSIIVNQNGNVGIGTTSPSSKLHVLGDITASGTLSSVGLFANDGTIILKNSANGSGLLVYPGIDESTSARFEIRTNNAWARTGFTLFTNGNFTIGTSNDQGYRFFVAGDAKVQGNILATGGITTNDSVTINGIKLSKSKDGVLYLDGNLVVKGGVTMYGTDATSSPSILDSLPIASTSSKGIAQFNPSDFAVKDGVVSFVGSVDGGVASSVAWGNITGKPTWIGSSKPSYSYSEITGAISTTELQNYLTQSSYLNVTSGDNRYLKLSGGTLKSGSSGTPLYIDSDVSESGIAVRLKGVNKTWIGYGVNYGAYLYNYANSNWIGIKDDGTPYFYNGTQNNLWHSGNDGSGSGLDADLLDGKHNGELTSINLVRCGSGVLDADTLVNSESLFKYYAGIASSSSNIPTYTGYQNALLEIPLHSNGVTSQFYFSYGKNPYYRAGVDKSWNEIAYKTDNVASATKLQTARTIWGQSFNGTSNVSGSLTGVTSITMSNDIFMDNNMGIGIKDTEGENLYVLLLNTKNIVRLGATKHRVQISGNDVNITYGSSATSGIYLDSTGEVGVGTTSPSHKLHVVGNTYLNGDVFVDELNTFDVLPRTNNAYSCGNSSLRWYQVYGNIGDFSGAVNMGSTLNVTGMTTMTNATITGDLRLKDTTNYGRAIYFGDGEYCYLEEASDDVMTIYASNGIKLNTSSTSYNVSINTNLLVSGGITMYSQRSLKNIKDERGLSLDELGAIKPIRYTWKDNRDNRLHIGGIADDIQQVLPEVVYKTNDGVLTMDYGNAAFAIASSLINPVIDHEKRIAMLEEENKQLRQEVERLKSA